MSRKNLITVVAALAIISSIIYLEGRSVRPTRDDNEGTNIALNREAKAARYESAHEISTPDGFINTDNITIGEFVGKKVVLVDFWTYSCINCQRTFPYLNAWHEKYKDKGLVIIGIHTPEFEFEKKYENVLAAVKKFELNHPVVLDNDFSTWQSYKNRYWPRKYLIDIDGFIVYDHIGEGGYEETERRIQEALHERMEVLGIDDTIDTSIVTSSETSDSKAKSPETYFGAFRNTNLGNGTSGETGTKTFSLPPKISPDTLYLSGTWNVTQEFAESVGTDARVTFTFSATNVFFVAAAKSNTPVSIFLDGKPLPKEQFGDDVKLVNGIPTVTVREDRLYEIINDVSGTHTLELRSASGLKAFTFTFG